MYENEITHWSRTVRIITIYTVRMMIYMSPQSCHKCWYVATKNTLFLQFPPQKQESRIYTLRLRIAHTRIDSVDVTCRLGRCKTLPSVIKNWKVTLLPAWRRKNLRKLMQISTLHRNISIRRARREKIKAFPYISKPIFRLSPLKIQSI